VRKFAVQDGLLLLHTLSNTLIAYNGVARFIWELIETGCTQAEIVAAVAARWEIPFSLAQDDVRAIVALWRAQGLLVSPGEAPVRVAEPPKDTIAVAPSAPSTQWTCTIRGVAIAFTVADDLLTSVRALFGHLETPGAVPQASMTLAKTPSGELTFVEDGTERLRTSDPALALGSLHVAVLERIRPGVQWFALIHGAALARGGQGIALLGPSGSGKSTLAAGLMSAGFDFLADDLVALSAPDAAIVPWPLPLSVKPGATDILTERHPALAQATRYRTKGVEARLLLPPAGAWNAAPARLRTLIFPSFAAGAAPELRRLSSFEALQRLLSDRIWIGDPITEELVAAFIAWLDATPAYAISFGTLADAIEMVESVVP
jgi:hypothetical protein